MARGSVHKRCQCRDKNGRQAKTCRKDHGSWWFRIESIPDAVTGRRRQTSRGGFGTKPEAEEAMTRTLHELDRGSWVDDRGVTVGEWLNTWLDEAGGLQDGLPSFEVGVHLRSLRIHWSSPTATMMSVPIAKVL